MDSTFILVYLRAHDSVATHEKSKNSIIMLIPLWYTKKQGSFPYKRLFFSHYKPVFSHYSSLFPLFSHVEVSINGVAQNGWSKNWNNLHKNGGFSGVYIYICILYTTILGNFHTSHCIPLLNGRDMIYIVYTHPYIPKSGWLRNESPRSVGFPASKTGATICLAFFRRAPTALSAATPWWHQMDIAATRCQKRWVKNGRYMGYPKRDGL